MSQIGIQPGNPTDDNRKNTFFPFEPSDHVSPELPGNNNWYWRFSQNPGDKVSFSCSLLVVSKQ